MFPGRDGVGAGLKDRLESKRKEHPGVLTDVTRAR